jgi:polysaccharide export outer membrane protein
MNRRASVAGRLLASLSLLAVWALPLGAAEEKPASCAAAPAPDTGDRVAPALCIAAGDMLDVNVFDTPELSARLRVDSNGDVALPVGGDLHVAGETAKQAGAAMEALLRNHEILNDPHVSVFISEYATQGASVLGEVKAPGVYPVLGVHGLLDFISVAGGVTPIAGKDVTITHKNDPAHPLVIRLDNARDLAARTNAQILPGDIIIVSRSGVVYVLGDLLRPGAFLIEANDRLTAVQAVALAMGTNRTAALDHCRLIRKTAQGRVEMKLRLKRILAGKDSDLAVEDGDILFVPSSLGKNLVYRGIEAAVTMTQSVVAYSAASTL